MDAPTTPARSRIMSSIHSKDTKPEMLVRQRLHAMGFRYRLHDKRLPGRPDIVLPKYRAIIQIQGCFWHGHESCYLFKWPKTREEFWREKIGRNIRRDADNHAKLLEQGWKVLIWWECNIKNNEQFEDNLKKVVMWLTDGNNYLEIR